MKISPARSAAFDILLKIERDRAFSSILLPEYEKQLTPRDRALCHRLTLGVLRRQLFLDHYINGAARSKNLDLAVRISLRLGLFQLWFLDKVPAHSAVNESVELVHRAKKSSARTMVNAILRRAKQKPEYSNLADEIQRISIESSHPRWLIEKWANQFGADETARLAEANNTESALSFRLTARAPADLSFAGTRPSSSVPGCFLVDEMTPKLSAASADGLIYFQDEGSQLVAAAVDIPFGGSFLDVCASPGSKVTQIAGLNASVFPVAGDIYSHRTRFLLENLRSQGVTDAAVVQYDAETTMPFRGKAFDSVLVDAPCTGTGTIRHNPELRYFIRPGDPAELSKKQLRILKNASNLVKEGGSLIYSTCSLEVEEGEQVVDEFIAAESSFRLVPPRVPATHITEAGYARTRPDIDGMDGFFIAALERVRQS